MFSILPPLLTFQGFAPLLLRITLGSIFFLWGYKKLKKSRRENTSTAVSEKNIKHLFIASVETLLGALFIVGFLTQVAAVISTFVFGYKIIKKIQAKSFLTDGVNYYLILFIISISLIFTGAGYIAIDLPL